MNKKHLPLFGVGPIYCFTITFIPNLATLGVSIGFVRMMILDIQLG